MLKGTFVAIVLAVSILAVGGLVVPILTGTEVEIGGFVEVLPVSGLVYLVANFTLDSIIPERKAVKTLGEKLFAGKFGVGVFVAFWVLVLLFSILILLR